MERDLYETKFGFFIEENLISDTRKKPLLLANLSNVPLSYVKDINRPSDLND